MESTVSLVTGGARGIGKAICEAILSNKGQVCIVDISEDTGLETLLELQNKHGMELVIFIKADVVSKEQMEVAVSTAKTKFGHLDYIINNAGIGSAKMDDWNRMIDVNLKGVMIGTLLAQTHLIDGNGKKGGMVINTASLLGLIPLPALPAYVASKSAIIGWTQCLGAEENVLKTGVKVNAVCPDLTDTGFVPDKFVAKYPNTIQQPSNVADEVIALMKSNLSGSIRVVSRKRGIYDHKYKYYS